MRLFGKTYAVFAVDYSGNVYGLTNYYLKRDVTGRTIAEPNSKMESFVLDPLRVQIFSSRIWEVKNKSKWSRPLQIDPMDNPSNLVSVRKAHEKKPIYRNVNEMFQKSIQPLVDNFHSVKCPDWDKTIKVKRFFLYRVGSNNGIEFDMKDRWNKTHGAFPRNVSFNVIELKED